MFPPCEASVLGVIDSLTLGRCFFRVAISPAVRERGAAGAAGSAARPRVGAGEPLPASGTRGANRTCPAAAGDGNARIADPDTDRTTARLVRISAFLHLHRDELQTVLDTPRMDAFTFSTPVRVRFADTDAQGIAHNSAYLVWFEVARVEYLREHAGGYQALRDRGFEALVLESFCRYLVPTRFDDVLHVHARCVHLCAARFRFECL